MTVSRSPNVCVPCRFVAKATDICPSCGANMVGRSYRWRAPKKTNDVAWARIERGDWLWDHRAVERFPKVWRPRLGKLRQRGKIRSARMIG